MSPATGAGLGCARGCAARRRRGAGRRSGGRGPRAARAFLLLGRVRDEVSYRVALRHRHPGRLGMTHGIRRGLTNYGDPAFSLFIRGAYARGSGLTTEDLARPTIGIAQPWSEFNPCHRHLREVAEAVKRGVWQAGGLPLEFPTISLGEIYLSPTSMLFRNLMAMDTEEMILGQPMDGVVLLGGCDKTLPAQLKIGR